MTEQNSSQLLDNLCSLNNYCISRDNRREFLDSIVTSALGLLDCDSVALILSDEQNNNSLCYVSCSGNGTENYMGMVLNRSEGIQGSVLREGQSVLINNLSQASIFPAGSNNSNAYLAIPLKLHNKTYGLIEAHGHSFSSKQIPLLELMANQVILILLICDSREQDSNQPDSMGSSQEIKGLVGQEKIITVSSIVQSLLDKVKKIASAESPVLISGESGTGKELFASNIHLNSLRSNKSIVRVNCAALSRGIFESELFGHVEGAFTDARQNKIGFFEQANGGTLFLDEISELTPNIQSSLLRVLNDGYYYPVGAEFSKKVDIRLIVATNRNLLECVRKGTFREDLYYRLAVFFC